MFSFSIILESNNLSESTSLDFITADENVYNYWTDGINALLRMYFDVNYFNSIK